jgi:hypothetical protein
MKLTNKQEKGIRMREIKYLKTQSWLLKLTLRMNPDTLLGQWIKEIVAH